MDNLLDDRRPSVPPASATTVARRPKQVVVALLAVTIGLVQVFGTVLVIHDSTTPIPRIRGVIIAAALFIVLVALGRGLPERTRRWLFLALVCYLAGAIGVEAINGTLRGADRLLYYWIGTTVEETVEMLACVVAIGAIARVIADRWELSASPSSDPAPQVD